MSQKTCAESPPAQKLTAGVERAVWFEKACVSMSYEDHQKKKKDRKMSVADRPCQRPGMPWDRNCVIDPNVSRGLDGWQLGSGTNQLEGAVDGATVQSLRLPCRVLDLQACFYMLDRRGYE